LKVGSGKQWRCLFSYRGRNINLNSGGTLFSNSLSLYEFKIFYLHRLCLGGWAEHGERTGGFYACNRYETAKREGVVRDIIILNFS